MIGTTRVSNSFSKKSQGLFWPIVFFYFKQGFSAFFHQNEIGNHTVI
jgi:hypothetical protein